MGLLKPERAGIIVVLAMVTVAVVLNVIAPRILGQAMDVIFAGVVGKQLPAGGHQRAVHRRTARPGPGQLRGHAGQDGRRPGLGIDFQQLAFLISVVLVMYFVANIFLWLAGLRPERPGHAGGPQAARRHREQAQQAAAELLRHPPARRHPLPGHERRGQHPAGAAAGVRAARELGADGHRHRDHDVHRVLAAGPDRARSRCRSPAVAAGIIGSRSQKLFAAQWKNTGDAQRPDRGILLRPRPRPGLRPRRRHAGPLRRAERGTLQGQLRRPVRLRHDHAGHEVRRPTSATSASPSSAGCAWPRAR